MSEAAVCPLELLRQAVDQAQHGLYSERPQGMVAGPAQAAPTVTGSDTFSVSDLFGLAEISRAEPYPKTGGIKLWVHPVSPDDTIWLNAQAVKEDHGQNLQDQGAALLQNRIRAMTYQV